MSRRAGSPKLELNVELSPPRANPIVESPNTSISSRETSPGSSCVSSEQEEERSMQCPDSREATSMVLVGCHRCLMYVISSNADPKCPRYQNTALLGDLLNEESPMKDTDEIQAHERREGRRITTWTKRSALAKKDEGARSSVTL